MNYLRTLKCINIRIYIYIYSMEQKVSYAFLLGLAFVTDVNNILNDNNTNRSNGRSYRTSII